jgi:streptomycin 6-kinase
MSGADKARWLGEFIVGTWRELDEPCSERVVERAVAFAAARRDAFDRETAVLVHGDAHCANLLRDDADGGFKLIDPDGLFAEPACDVAVPMREYSRELLEAGDVGAAARDRCALLSAMTGVDPQPIWEWGFLERVSSGLLLLRVGRSELGTETLDVAEAIVSA